MPVGARRRNRTWGGLLAVCLSIAALAGMGVFAIVVFADTERAFSRMTRGEGLMPLTMWEPAPAYRSGVRQRRCQVEAAWSDLQVTEYEEGGESSADSRTLIGSMRWTARLIFAGLGIAAVAPGVWWFAAWRAKFDAESPVTESRASCRAGTGGGAPTSC